MTHRKEGILMNSELRARLESLADPGYRAFSARLLPVGTPLLGVRLPALRRIARELSRGGLAGLSGWGGGRQL